MRLQIDYIQGMGARCAGSDPDIIALAQAAKAAKKIYITGRSANVCHMLGRARGEGSGGVSGAAARCKSAHFDLRSGGRPSCSNLLA